MLKRTLTIGVLMVLGLSLAAFSPVEPASSVPTEGELEIELEEWTVYFIWGTTGTPLTNAGPVTLQIESPPTEVAEVYAQIPTASLNRLPQRIRDRIAGASSALYNHHDFDCVLTVNRPWKSGSLVRAYAYWDCTAEQRTDETYLRLTLWENFTLIGEDGGEWLSVRRQSRSVEGPCASGLAVYYHRVTAHVRFHNGQTRSAYEDRSSTITCP